MSIAVDADQAFLTEIARIAEEVAGPNAADVDTNARFPIESLTALREARALSAFVPTEHGGDGVSFAALAEACFLLGKRCSASAMVFAMHQIQVATLVRHLDDGFFTDYLRQLCAEQRLVASVTSEVGTGGDMGSSVASVTPDDDALVSFEKQAPTVSYGQYADDLLVTLRSGPDAGKNDQVAVLVRGDQVQLEPTGSWDPLGMRGTCSPGFVVRATVPAEQVMATPFAQASAESMVPVSHVLWSHLWLGIATDAFDRARAFVRAAARRTPGVVPVSATRLSSLLSELALLRAEVAAGLAAFGVEDREQLTTMAAALRFNSLKISASEKAPEICRGAMGVCGIMGYKNDSPFSIGRHLRDAMSACLMVANDRIHATNASLLLIAKEV